MGKLILQKTYKGYLLRIEEAEDDPSFYVYSATDRSNDEVLMHGKALRKRSLGLLTMNMETVVNNHIVHEKLMLKHGIMDILNERFTQRKL